MASSRMRKINDTAREALAAVLLEDIEDPRLRLVTITAVDISPDLRHAKIYVTTHGGPERYDAMLAGLNSAKRRIRAALATRVSMKYLPDLHFHLDESIDEGMRIYRALHADDAADESEA